MAKQDKELREKIDIAVSKCPECLGTGTFYKGYIGSPCYKCNGKGITIDYNQIISVARPIIAKQEYDKAFNEGVKTTTTAMDSTIDGLLKEAKKQERVETGEYLEHCHLSHCETHRLISIHDIERLKSGQALEGEE